MGIRLITPPCEGLVVWFAVDKDKQPWPAVNTACLDSNYLLKILGDEKFTRSAKLHQLSTFKCNLTNAIVSDSRIRAQLRVARKAALDHAKSEAGVETQHAHLSSVPYTIFLVKLSQEVEELPEWPPSAQKPVSWELPADVQLFCCRPIDWKVK